MVFECLTKHKIALCTGGAGFLGSALVRELVSQSTEVIVFDNFSAGTEANLFDVYDKISIVRGDILSSSFAQTVKTYKPDIVFHLAAEPFIPDAYNNPERFFETNIRGTMNVLSACALFDVPKIVNYSSSEVYGSNLFPNVPMDETHPTLPHSTYAVSKLAAERLAHVWAWERKLPIVNVRPFNCFGPRETQPYIIPEIIRQLAHPAVPGLSKTAKVRLGNLDARRDFTYAEDHARAVRMLAEKGKNGETYNIGTGENHAVGEIVAEIASLMDIKAEIQSDKSKMRPYDVEELLCDASKVEKLTNWKPEVPFRTGLKLTIRHYLERGKWVYER